MKQFFARMFNTEFLPMSEVRKIKVIIVMIFLFIMTLASVPFSLVFDYSLGFKISVIVALFIWFILLIVLMKFGRYKVAMQLSIVYAIALTLFYTQGTSSFYAYLFFYIVLTVIVFYQELFLFISYGTLTLGWGIFYVFLQKDAFIALGQSEGSIYLFFIILAVFYIIFFLQIIYSEKLYTDLNYDWVKMNQIIDKYQDQILFFLEEERKKHKEPLLYEDLVFQKAADQLSIFICEQFRENGKEIANVLDLYIYIHERGLKHILENEDFGVATKKIANRLDKYLLNRRTTMMSMILNFSTKFRKTVKYKESRYEYQISNLTSSLEQQVVALAFVYLYLANEVTGLDEYDQMSRIMTKEEIAKLFLSQEINDFFTPELIAFFTDNQSLFETYLHL